ncbi:hypothetical protein M011DRAFT_164317 [Sporormia fimetaria CBS 119925]|uniref:Uncharacterized protein n=1 Tax=Sporormia fimetaria CBS 119925 TaxID=1340428 RepID=A0A6A6V484_9PLEO|nr:hypothetical protein M011DRAFT_164317 [Sporormia fimetaria CBS 119925]
MAAPSVGKPVENGRPNALAEIQFASLLEPDLTPSEDETADDPALQLETVQSAIGVSIGHQQTHLISPKTPAIEKAAALDDSDGDAFFSGWQQHHRGAEPELSESEDVPVKTTQEVEIHLPVQPKQDPTLRLPSPWRADARKWVDTSQRKTTLRDSLARSRGRALSGNFTTDSWKKYINFSMPSLPKTPTVPSFSFSSYSMLSLEGGQGQRGQNKSTENLPAEQSHTARHRQISNADDEAYSPMSGPGEPFHFSQTPGNESGSTEPPSSSSSGAQLTVPSTDRRPRPVLRKSASEGSLLLHRQKSMASSLGDDTRFEHVQAQVNSRMKAIKDSWQDANFKLPSLPTIPSFGFSGREDSSSVSTNNRSSSFRVSFLPSASSLSKSASTKTSKTKTTSADAPSTSSSNAYPFFTKALQELTGDVVVLGGYRGSILRSAEPPHRQLWVPIKVGLNLRKVDLQLGLNPEDEETEEERIIPGGMLTHIGPVDISKRLLKRLRTCENAKRGLLRVHNYGYDWRLSPHLLSERLQKFLKTLSCNQVGIPPEQRGAVVIAHSLGGLITRHAINQHPELVSGVVYAGVPQTCVNILGPLRNGDEVLLSSRVLTAQVNFTIRTSFALLPLDGKCFINKHTKEEYPIDFFNPATWSEYRLSPCIAPALPPPNTAAVRRNASGILSAMSSALPGRKSSLGLNKSTTNLTKPPSASEQTLEPPSPLSDAADVAKNAASKVTGPLSTQKSEGGMAPQMNQNTTSRPDAPSTSPSTTVTIPPSAARAYLTRTLASVKRFKTELAHSPAHTISNAYPPIAVLYGKSVPTVYGAKVESREAIKRADAYDELAFASGDGVVLARAAQVPKGYQVVRGGVVSSERGHLTLLGDLEAVGRGGVMGECLAVRGVAYVGLDHGR